MPRDFLLRGVDAESLKPRETVELTQEEKRKNWWYYHRGHVIMVAMLAAVIFSILFSVFTKVNPDYTVGVVCSYDVPDHSLRELERCLTQYADDRNGDGKVVVSAVSFIFGNPNPSSYEQLQMQQASMTRFMVDFADNASMIFFHEEQAFDSMGEEMSGLFLYNDGTPQPEGALDFENVMRPWGDFRGLDQFVPVSENEEEVPSSAYDTFFRLLRVSVRSAEGSSIEKDEKDMAYYQDCLALYQRLLTGEALSADAE